MLHIISPMCRVVAVIRTYMTYVWGFGADKPVPGLQPQVVAADEDAEGVREIPSKSIYFSSY